MEGLLGWTGSSTFCRGTGSVFLHSYNSLNSLPLAVVQGAKEALDLGITGPEGIEISRPEEVRKTLCPLLQFVSCRLTGSDIQNGSCIAFYIGDSQPEASQEQLPPC